MACLAVAAGAQAQIAPLSLIPTEHRAGSSESASPPKLELYSADLPTLAAALGVPAPPDGATHLEYQPATDTVARPGRAGDWLAESFVVDFRDQAVERLYRRFLRERSSGTARDSLVRFVADVVVEGHGRGWDLASRVAERLEGDCTEHAVLVTALARRAGIPARVVLGAAVVRSEDVWATYGHAWSEVFEDGRWHIADAARSG